MQKPNDVVHTSTRPVYNKIPADIESSVPVTRFAVMLSGLYVERTPRPIETPIGVARE